ncbi:MBL fold metallo-hydrolase [Streptomyces sp. NPDC059957]|uniref:MBL fold metallo-hydrolase n=1 Tax=unclassified Streptomyces TaxID=2593676 RepID=UPI00365D51D7
MDPCEVSLIVITHGHIDHFGSAAELRRLTGAPVAGHIADLGPYRSGRVREPYLPTGPMGRIMPTPGHTAGSVSVLTDDGDLVAGDLVANSFMGLIPGRPANPPFHDDPRQNLTSLRAMLALDPTRLHVGHGAPLEPGRVRRWADRESERLSRREAAGRIATRAT